MTIEAEELRSGPFDGPREQEAWVIAGSQTLATAISLALETPML